MSDRGPERECIFTFTSEQRRALETAALHYQEKIAWNMPLSDALAALSRPAECPRCAELERELESFREETKAHGWRGKLI